MSDTLGILQTIWNHSPDGYIFLPMRNGSWEEPAGVLASEVEEYWYDPLADCYYTPATFSAPQRLAENQQPMGVLYADLDADFNPRRLQEIPPSLLVETSPNSFQAVWLLSETLPPEEALILNRRLSLHLEADHGSWISTKLLRVPGTTNMKRGGVEVTVREWEPARKLPLGQFDRYLPKVPVAKALQISGGCPEVPTLEEHQAILAKLWPTLGHRVKLRLSEQQVADRSLHLARLAKNLAELGLPPVENFQILSRLRANKFFDRPDVLWNSVVLTAYEQFPADA